jgi:uncharacterized membrane protein YczE
MTDATCAGCGTTDDTVRARPWHELEVTLCAGCYAALTGEPVDTRTAFTPAWTVLVIGLLLAAAGAAVYILTR